MRDKGSSTRPAVPAHAYSEMGALEGAMASGVMWMRKRFAEYVRDPTWLQERLRQSREEVERYRPAALEYCRCFATTPVEEIPFGQMLEGEKALKEVRENLRNGAVCSFLLEQLEAAKVVRLVTTKARTKEALEVGDTIDGLSPYERTRLVALARDFARKAKEREASYGDADDDEEEPPEVRS